MTTVTGASPPLSINEYLVYELLIDMPDGLARAAQARRIATRAERLLKTLAAEDELSVILGWLGRCRLVHKLDQVQAPPDSRDRFQVPDLLAVFDHHGRAVTALIEVKTKKLDFTKPLSAPLLDWKGDYLARLVRYGEELKVPVLVAVRVDPFGLWTLFDVRHLKKAVAHYKITFNDAVRQSLMGELAGDFAVAYRAGAGFHVVYEKVDKGEANEDGTVTYTMVVRDAYMTGGGRRVSDTADLGPLLFAAPFDYRDAELGQIVTQDFEIPPEGQLQWAHQALVAHLANRYPEEGRGIRWREELLQYRMPVTRDQFRAAAERAMNCGIVRHLIDLQPHDLPDFLRAGASAPTTAPGGASG